MLLLNSLHILCFGDSLTQGWSGSSMSVHPYNIQLETSLKASFPLTSFATDNQGIGGDQTECPPNSCPGFLPRMGDLYQKPDDHETYDWAIILGGTNDLNWGRNASQIYTSLQKIWDIPLSHGTKVLALTVPECGGCVPFVNEQVKPLNEMILNHTANNFYTFNLYDSIPYKSMPEEKRKEIWDDIIHFTAKGYDLMGSRIAEILVKILKGSGSETLKQDPVREDLKR